MLAGCCAPAVRGCGPALRARWPAGSARRLARGVQPRSWKGRKMNLAEFETVLLEILRHNQRLADAGAPVTSFLIPMAWGDPGLGKTTIVEAVAATLGWQVIQADLATRDPAELGGMPWVENGRAIRCRPDWLPDSGQGILFLDELPQAGVANMNIGATLVREHRIGEHFLPRGWMVVCAGNFQHNRAGTSAMPSHLRNRLLHLTVEADANAWAQWASRKGLDPMLIAYNRFRAAEYHHRFCATSNAYPTPRSWEMGSQVLGLDLPEALRRECLDGTVGEAAGADFAGFRQVCQSLPDVQAIIADPTTAPIPSDAMTLYALIGALAYNARPGNFAAIITYLDRLPEQEFAVAGVLDATARDETLRLTTAYTRWAAAHGELLSAS
ncbi:AAA family ATPase (plasmid) [Rhodovastum atsumiense]|uniref:AAA family ATPase n=2 Tax=Rhodovastum atsumiense TaxID=504468 RepID=A0A5M6IKM7_9PROT|nr:AAA family ATPase [Rhodovastum atsumiense]CAH2605741.1 AAA family ATPase [Rhodovastum atsumiense]